MRVALLGVLAFGIMAGRASAAVTSVIVATDQATGRGVIFHRGNECLVLTAGHVLGGKHAAYVSLSSGTRVVADELRDLPKPTDVWLGKLQATSVSMCPEPFAEGLIDDQLSTYPTGQLIAADANGASERILLSIRRAQADLLVLTFDARDERVEQGLSGSPVVFGGQLVGIATSIDKDKQQLVATRLDNISRQIGAMLFAPASPPSPLNASRARFGIKGLAAAMADDIRSARKSAELADAEAAQGERLAQQAAGYAKAAVAISSYPDFSIPTGKPVQYISSSADRHYSGQVEVTQNNDGTRTISPSGMGTLEMLTGSESSNVELGLFKGGTLLHGVVAYGTNVSNSAKVKRYSGAFRTGKKMGPYGIVIRVDDGKERQAFLEDGSLTGVIDFQDGRRWEGHWDSTGNADGTMLQWSSDGTLSRGGVWEHGKLIKPVVLRPER